MSVKKIGKALLFHHGLLPGFFYKIEAGQQRFTSAWLLESNIVDFQSIGKRPNYKYEKVSSDYDEKHKKIVAIVYEQIQQATLINPIRLYLMKDYSGRKQGDLLYCVYKGYIYKFNRAGYSDEEMLLQIMDLEDDERRKFERLKHKFSVAEQEEKQGKRPAVPEEVRIAVWRRDEGKCVKCSSRENLEYDHIIPISKGGSNTIRNIELLCEKCNREKSDEIS